VKRVFNVSAILIHDALQTTFPLSDAVINEAPWQCASLQLTDLLQLINGIKLPAVVESLLGLHGSKWRSPDGAPSYCRVHSRRPLASYAFINITLASYHLL